MNLSVADAALLINDIALRAGTASELAAMYDVDVEELRVFAENNMDAIKIAKEHYERTSEETEVTEQPTPTQLDDLWITQKFQRLWRIQKIAERLEKDAGYDAMAAREFRSYLMLAANELGQLLHRGSGDSGTGDTLSVDIQGVDMDALR